MLLRRKTHIPASLIGSVLAESVPESELEDALSHGTRVRVGADTLIMDENRLGREFLVVLSGELTVHRHGHKVATLGAGDIVGEIAMLTKVRRTATVSSVTAAEVVAFTGPEFTATLDDCPAFADYVLTTAVSRQAQAA